MTLTKKWVGLTLCSVTMCRTEELHGTTAEGQSDWSALCYLTLRAQKSILVYSGSTSCQTVHIATFVKYTQQCLIAGNNRVAFIASLLVRKLLQLAYNYFKHCTQVNTVNFTYTIVYLAVLIV